MNPEDLRKTYAEAPTEKLLDIIDNKFEYTDAAVKIALEELSKREISEADIKTYKETVESNFESAIRKLVFDDLSLAQKNFFIFCGFRLYILQ